MLKKMTLFLSMAWRSRCHSFSVGASKVAIAHYRCHSHTTVRSGPLEDKWLITRSEAWFIKIVCTAFVCSNSLDRYLGYFIDNLIPSHVIEVIRKLNNPKSGLKFFEFSRGKLNITHSFSTYNILLRSLCQAGLHDSAKMVYDCMRSDGQLPNSRLLGFLMSSYARAGRFDISKELLSEVQCNKFKVITFAYNELFNILVKHNEVDDAVHIFREHMGSHSHPDTCTFNILMRGLCRVEKIDEAFEFLNDMSNFGCSPDIFTYNTLIHGLCRINEVDRALDLLKEVRLKCEFVPDVVGYSTIISGYCKLNKMEKASSVLHEMIRSGIEPDAVTFTTLVDGFVKAGDMASAHAMHDKMCFHGCPPGIVTYSTHAWFV